MRVKMGLDDNGPFRELPALDFYPCRMQSASVSECATFPPNAIDSHIFLTKGLSIFRPIIYGNTAVVLTQKERESSSHLDHTHRWTLAVRSAASAPDSDQVGGADDLSYFIKRVTFKLHETYPNPSRSMSVEAVFDSYELTAT